MGTSETWRHTGGKESRLDYVAIPPNWQFFVLESWVDEELQIHGHHGHVPDHGAIGLRIEASIPG